MKNQQGAPEALTDFEHRHAIRQGYEIAASDGYFEARPQIDSSDRRKAFQAGFERGWDRHAALVDAQQPAPSAAAAKQSAACDKAPAGWLCIRQHGHDGPCAAEPTLSARSDEWIEGYAAGVRDGRADALRAPQPSPTPQADSQSAPTNTRQIAECYGDCPTDPKTCANPCKFEGRAARAPADSVTAPATDSYVQPVPDKCDRIVQICSAQARRWDMTEPTDAEAWEMWLSQPLTGHAQKLVGNFARAVLAKWGTPAVAGEPDYATFALWYADHIGDENKPVRDAALATYEAFATPQPTQAQAGAVTADDLKQPRNGAQWRVEWWNESCRMLLPANKRLDSFQAYRNGTLMFTIKEKSSIKGGQHG